MFLQHLLVYGTSVCLWYIQEAVFASLTDTQLFTIKRSLYKICTVDVQIVMIAHKYKISETKDRVTSTYTHDTHHALEARKPTCSLPSHISSCRGSCQLSSVTSWLCITQAPQVAAW